LGGLQPGSHFLGCALDSKQQEEILFCSTCRPNGLRCPPNLIKCVPGLKRLESKPSTSPLLNTKEKYVEMHFTCKDDFTFYTA
jgi:hypothetical protein